MNLDSKAIQTARAGTTLEVPQILLNYARVSRGPWRLKALIDREGRPVTSRFITVRPRVCSLELLWALLNSPVANAFAFTHLGKRDNLVGDMCKIPIPKGAAFDEIETAARAYLDAASSNAPPEDLQSLLLEVDAAVLRRYALPVELEWKLLSLFTGWGRVGVPFKQDRYFPRELKCPIRLSDFLDYESDWPSANRRRDKLVDKEIDGTITTDESLELAALQAFADYYLEKVSPRPTRVLEDLERRVFETASGQR